MSVQHTWMGRAGWQRASALAAVVCCALQASAAGQGPVPASFHKDIAALKKERAILLPLIKSELGRAFLQAVDGLTTPTDRVLFWKREPYEVLSEKEALAKLTAEEREHYTRLDWGEAEYYAPLFGTPLAYARPVDLLGEHGVERIGGKRILDFGYGSICQLRLMAMLGAEVVGVDVEEFLRSLYSSDSDQGPIRNESVEDAPAGSVKLVHGFWPSTTEVTKAVGGGYDLFISRDVLKRGYVNPSEETSLGKVTDLRASDSAFLAALHESLNPGALVLIYNIGYEPASVGGRYFPQDDIRCAFEEALWNEAGFELLAYDADDSEAAIEHSVGYGWHQGGRRLRAMYTLARRKL